MICRTSSSAFRPAVFAVACLYHVACGPAPHYDSALAASLASFAEGESGSVEWPEDAGNRGGERGPAADPLAARPFSLLRIMAANLTSGPSQSYEDAAIRIFQAFEPDVVLIQEFNYGRNTDDDLRRFVGAAFGSDFYYFRQADVAIPNGVISRYPLIESGQWDDTSVGNRDFAWARIDIPGDIDLWAVSVHLRTKNALTRENEARQLVHYIRQHVPDNSFLVVGGDFNSATRDERCVETLRSLLVIEWPFPADQSGNEGTNATRRRPYDWVLVDAKLDEREVPVTVGTGDDQVRLEGGLVFDSRVFTPTSLPPPVRCDDSGAPQMQHMAIIRDFAI